MRSYADQFLVRSGPTLPTSCPTRDPSYQHSDSHSVPYNTRTPIPSLQLFLRTPRGAPSELKHHLRQQKIREKSVRRCDTRVQTYQKIEM